MPARLSMRLNSQSTTPLSIGYDDDERQICTSVSFPVFSGTPEHRNKPESTHLADAGPIPLGRYYVVDRPTGGGRDWVRQNLWDFDGRGDWFALFRIDGNVNDYTRVRGTRRGNFRMHPGTRSVGCVTFTQKSHFDQARRILLSQSTATVPGSGLSYYGILTVT